MYHFQKNAIITVNSCFCQGIDACMPTIANRAHFSFLFALSLYVSFLKTQNEKDKCTIRLLVHQSHAGALIGRQGGKIKELRDRTNARIKVFQQCCPQSTDRICMLSGDDRNVLDAVEQIVEELKQIPIKGPVNPYTSFNYDPAMAPDYGGFSPAFPTSGRGGPPISPFSGGPRRSLGAPLPPMRGGGGLGGPDMRYDRGIGRDYDAGPYGGPIGGPPQYGGGGGLYGGYPGQNAIQTTQVSTFCNYSDNLLSFFEFC
ncbi:unnamed protein product [Strongylus vulgaris]|uniref:K Homology domain-containing protein n=1 Tax=Strongylus vulgaris TaxID=40348 RepID=A0A3P7KLC1_STRVU|nr:unnamed protein product [Strongylus vulgaris]